MGGIAGFISIRHMICSEKGINLKMAKRYSLAEVFLAAVRCINSDEECTDESCDKLRKVVRALQECPGGVFCPGCAASRHELSKLCQSGGYNVTIDPARVVATVRSDSKAGVLLFRDARGHTTMVHREVDRDTIMMVNRVKANSPLNAFHLYARRCVVPMRRGAATTIQRLWRGFVVRLVKWRCKVGAVTIQHTWPHFALLVWQSRCKAAAVTMQRFWRGSAVRSELYARNIAAATIQRVFKARTAARIARSFIFVAVDDIM